MVFWRIVGDILDIPGKICGILIAMLNGIGNLFTMFSRSILYYELEHARKYRLLTETDLALAIGEPGRYGGLASGRADAIQDALHRRGLQMMGEDED